MLLGAATGSAAGRRRAVLAFCLALFAVVPIGARRSAAQVQEQVSPPAQQNPQTPADQAIHHLDLQTKLLADQAIHKLDLQTELRRQKEPQEPYRLNLPPETVWVAVVVGVIVLLYIFRDMIPILRAGRGGAWAEDEIAALDTGSRAPDVVLEVADDLAAQGRFVEAMHVLLLQALADIRRRLHEQFANSMTSREILRSRQLADTLRRPLREVISRVEWTYFGGHPAAREDYLACRSSFGALAQALQRGAAT